MADSVKERYVRVRSLSNQQVFYGMLDSSGTLQLFDEAPWLGGKATGEILKEGAYALLPPCTPSKIVAIGKNYVDHAAEFGGTVPQEPLMFLKPPSSLLAPEGRIRLTPLSRRVDYEGELALVMGENAQIWGYTIANDVTARDLQKRDGQWTRAKGFDTFCPLGPWVVREIAPQARLETYLNDGATPVQSASLHQMVFAPLVLIQAITQVMTLLPGDLILTGTPAGVGPLKAGDRVKIVIEGIGALENSVEPPQNGAV